MSAIETGDIPLFLLRVDPHAVDDLTYGLLRALHAHFDAQPKSRVTIVEAVHALAAAVAPLLSGSSAGELRAVFLRAIASELDHPPALERDAGAFDLPAFLQPRH